MLAFIALKEGQAVLYAKTIFRFCLNKLLNFFIEVPIKILRDMEARKALICHGIKESLDIPSICGVNREHY